jgi:hypothetical protein
MSIYNSRISQLLVVGLALQLASSCKKASKSSEDSSSGPRKFAAADAIGFADVPELKAQSTAIRKDLKEDFCIHVYKLPLKSDFSAELAVLCTDKKPNETFTDFDRHAALVGGQPRSIKLSLEHKPDGYTSAVFGTVYRVPIVPKWVRSAKVPYYMTSASEFSYLNRQGEVLEDLTAELGGDLQFGKWRMTYKSDIQTPASTQFSNQLKTELNSFQVHGGNPDIGLGSEHMIDIDNPDYRVYNTTTVTIGNDDNASSTLITIIRVEVKNNGFLETAEKIISDSATSQATHVRDGLIRELEAGNFRQ